MGVRLIPHTVARRELTQHLIDISGSNIAFTTCNLADLSKEELFAIIGEPKTAALSYTDMSPLGPELPKQLVGKAPWDSWTDEDEEDIRLIDLGESFHFESVPDQLAQPSELRAPETLFIGKFDYKLDLWRVGCVVSILRCTCRSEY